LALDVDRRAWTTGDGRKAIFDGAVEWLWRRQVLLPAVSTLHRLVGEVVTAAQKRLFGTLLGLITAGQGSPASASPRRETGPRDQGDHAGRSRR
jgi:hypothetical protein